MYRLFCTQCTSCPPFSELINKDIERKVCACNISGKPTNHSYVPLSVYKDDVWCKSTRVYVNIRTPPTLTSKLGCLFIRRQSNVPPSICHQHYVGVGNKASKLFNKSNENVLKCPRALRETWPRGQIKLGPKHMAKLVVFILFFSEWAATWKQTKHTYRVSSTYSQYCCYRGIVR